MPQRKIMEDRTEIETLLPWYVTGKLSDADVEKVDRYISDHPDLAMQLDLINSERLETTLINEEITVPSSISIDRLMAGMDDAFGPEQKPANINWFRSVWSDISSAFKLPVVQFAGVAAALLIVIQSVSIGVLVQNNKTTGGAYTTASGPETSDSDGIEMLVTFNQSATAIEISNLLEETNGSIVKGPLAGGFYRIKFSIQEKSPEKIDALAKALQARKNIIEFISGVE